MWLRKSDDFRHKISISTNTHLGGYMELLKTILAENEGERNDQFDCE